jgi:diadenosine tetraphosphate (Ap4A) HIT family hydrolase
MQTSSAKCDFCNEFSGEPGNAFRRIYGGTPESRVLFRSDQFAVIPSLGQIFEGYLLVLPVMHFNALGDLPGPFIDELAQVCQLAGKALRSEYGPFIFFEHGTRSEDVGGCGIYHAHLHAAPIGPASDPIDLLKLRFPFTQLARLDEINEQSANLPCYLFYQDSRERLYLFDTGPLPSQYMRKVLAEALDSSDWDWRAAAREERLLATIRRLSEQFDQARQSDHAPHP